MLGDNKSIKPLIDIYRDKFYNYFAPKKHVLRSWEFCTRVILAVHRIWVKIFTGICLANQLKLIHKRQNISEQYIFFNNIKIKGLKGTVFIYSGSISEIIRIYIPETFC